MISLTSIIIPTFNRSELLRETLNSVFNQTYQNWECIIVDDNSSDNSKEVIESFTEKDSRFQYFFGPDYDLKGANACRNFAFRKSTGDFIQYLDDDDLLGSNKIESQINVLSNSSSDAIATSKWDFFRKSVGDVESQNLDVYRNFDDIEDFIFSLSFCHCYFPPLAYLIPRELIIRAGEWNEQLEINQDGEFMTRIFTKIKKVVFAEGAQVYYRQHEGPRTSFLNSEKKISQAIKSWDLIESTFQLRFGHKTRLVEVSRNDLARNMGKNLTKNKTFTFLPLIKLFKKVSRKLFKDWP